MPLFTEEQEGKREQGMITSTANKKVKELVELSAKAKARNAAGVFLAEGVKLFMEAPAERIEAVYVEESCYARADGEVRRKLCSVPYELVSSGVFCRISDTKTPQGILTVVRQSRRPLQALLAGEDAKAPLLLILEDIQDPGNLGTMFRTAEGAGANGIVMTKNTADVYQPKTVRSTMGSIYRVPFFITEDLGETLQQLKTLGIRVYAAHLTQGACLYDEPGYTAGTAFLIGNEGNGLKEETVSLADRAVRIPMAGRVESLNAAMAAGILLYEAARQRRPRGPQTPDT